VTAVTIAVFAAVLAVVAFDWVHRTKAALAGAAIVVLLGVLDADEAVDSVDWATLGLLVGMMIIVGVAERTGMFRYLALWVARLSQGRPLRLIFLLSGLTAVLSAFLDNLTAILLVVPVTIFLSELLAISAIPLVLTEVIASNVGGTATLIGDPPNIMIGTHVEELSFLDFIVNLGPPALVTLIVVTAFLYLTSRRHLRVDPERMKHVNTLRPADEIEGRPFLTRSLLVLVGTIVGFFLHAPLHVEPAVVALVGATAMLLVAVPDMEIAFERVEWNTIFFFIGLFVIVGALEAEGVVGDVADLIGDATGGSLTAETLGILWASAVGAAAVDNIPFTAAMIPVVDQLQAGDEFNDARWWALALGTCFGGNATLIAAAANVAAAGVLEREGQPISFGRFLMAGLPVSAISLVIATAYLLLFQL
jgi:Na+/H+ antiporter NhaD/arsenite permease-like protein